jgi:MSHA pilin protein MshA
MLKAQKGFTLIELVVVIVLLGILGVTALAKFQDLSTDAQTAANAGVAAEISSGASINYAARSLNASNGTSTTLLTCSGVATAVLSSTLDTDYVVGGGTCVGATSGDSVNCTVTNAPGTVATASVLCIN